MRRAFGVLFGVGTQLAFAVTAWRLFDFLAGGHAAAPAGPLWVDAILAAQFGLVHSLLLHPAIRARLKGIVSQAFYGCFFCLTTCGGLWLMFLFWRGGPVLWEMSGVPAWLMTTLFYASWAALFYSLWLTGLGYQTGWQPWWYWFRRRPAPKRAFDPRGAYRLLRHPVYLSFAGLVWFGPVLSADRLVLVAVWTIYIVVGSRLKDLRLLHYVGDAYRRYAERVPGYPLVGLGSLGRWTSSGDAITQSGQIAA